MLRARAAALALVLVAAPAARAGGPEPIEFDRSLDLPLTAGLGATWILSELFKEQLASDDCRVCDVNAFDAGARRRLVWSHPDPARRLSDLVAFAVVPTTLATHAFIAARSSGDTRAAWTDLMVIVEAATIAANVNQITKFAVARQRPYAHYANADFPDYVPDPDDNWSFFSGHTTLAFSLAAAAATVSELRGYDSAPWVWAGGMTLATSVAYLRVAGDRHYLSDVITGAVIGTAIGIAMPRLLHGRKEGGREGEGAHVTPILGGFAIAF